MVPCKELIELGRVMLEEHSHRIAGEKIQALAEAKKPSLKERAEDTADCIIKAGKITSVCGNRTYLIGDLMTFEKKTPGFMQNICDHIKEQGYLDDPEE